MIKATERSTKAIIEELKTFNTVIKATERSTKAIIEELKTFNTVIIEELKILTNLLL